MGLKLQPWHFAIAMTACNKVRLSTFTQLALTFSQGSRSDLCLQLRDMMLASGVSLTPLAHAASLPSLQPNEAIDLARDLEASDT